MVHQIVFLCERVGSGCCHFFLEVGVKSLGKWLVDWSGALVLLDFSTASNMSREEGLGTCLLQG